MTVFTKAGKAAAAAEPVPDYGDGASAHVKACAHDAGVTVLLVGHDANGRRFTRGARSVYGAYFTMRACWGLDRAWLVSDSGKRTLLMRRG